MIGVLASALFPGRIGEPSRVIVLTRRLDGPTSRLLAMVAGTVFSQTLINLLALAILAGVTFTGVPLLHGDVAWRLAIDCRCGADHGTDVHRHESVLTIATHSGRSLRRSRDATGVSFHSSGCSSPAWYLPCSSSLSLVPGYTHTTTEKKASVRTL
jgi:hypothetical protein